VTSVKQKINWRLVIKLIIYPVAVFGNKTFQIGNSDRSVNFIHKNIIVYRLLIYLKKALFNSRIYDTSDEMGKNICSIN